ncbi:hypothetical protein [Pseudomonas sp. GM80]|uniref:hypothetical protein n=1 Tax=Pseudomonas sp. GM80 TaxID=1144339 RepID=UPI00026F95BE|nr:hypothetical protein [Pseudomonas sp. GM80]EJN18697.1 hypothetical protein PMI37_05727 [Pseudomonas sp. GM80]
MSEIRTHSGTHRNPAYAPPAPEEPNRFRTSEESGTQKLQHNTQSMTALLREEPSVDPIETNSLCCVAAGIIAPISATTEVLIPHEKLREAPSHEATLIAQDRPLAQLVVGYGQVLDTTASQAEPPQSPATVYLCQHLKLGTCLSAETKEVQNG